MLKADDSLDVFGVHAIGGIAGALLTGVFNSPALGGPSFPVDWFTGKLVTEADYSIMSQFIVQAKAVGVSLVWSGVVAFLSYKIADLLVGMRVPEEEERQGLDTTAHGETAYN
jgi:Amt family ammonium transporter